VQHRSERIAAARRYLAPCSIPAKRDGVARLAVIGESSGDLLAKQLAQRLEAPQCGGRYEVLNCAQPGSALEHVERRFDEVVAAAPDVLVLLFGHNIFFRFELDESKLRLQALRAHSCILSQFSAEPPAEETPPLEERLAALEEFLRRAALATRAKGIAIATATMPGNLWLPPGAGPGDEYDPRFLEARLVAARGCRDVAIQRLETLAAERDQPYWHYQLGEQLARAGDTRRAYRELHLALDADHIGMRAPGRLNDLLRRVAAEEGVLLRDTERAVELRAPGGLPGWESFSDNCHLLPEALDHEVDGLLNLLQETDPDLPPACAAKPSQPSRKGLRDTLVGVFDVAVSGPPDLAQRWYRALALAVESWLRRDPDRTVRDVTEFLAGSAFASLPKDERADLLVAVAEGYYQGGSRERAFALNQQARDAGDADAWVQKGLFHVRQDEPEVAAAAFEQALAVDGARQDALFSGNSAGIQPRVPSALTQPKRSKRHGVRGPN
jgi:tetratricopeptide (TPR) repeat protein